MTEKRGGETWRCGGKKWGRGMEEGVEERGEGGVEKRGGEMWRESWGREGWRRGVEERGGEESVDERMDVWRGG